MQMAAGAVTRAADGLGLSAYDAAFRYDRVALTVTSTAPDIGRKLNVDRLSSITTAVASMAGMDGGNGGWPVLHGTNPVGSSGLKLAIDEDQLFDSERSHTPEQVAFLAMNGTSSENAAPYLRTGIASGVSNSSWTTVTLDRSYTSMVVVATPNYDNASPPRVARVREVTGDGSQFQVKVDRDVRPKVYQTTGKWFTPWQLAKSLRRMGFEVKRSGGPNRIWVSWEGLQHAADSLGLDLDVLPTPEIQPLIHDDEPIGTINVRGFLYGGPKTSEDHPTAV